MVRKLLLTLGLGLFCSLLYAQTVTFPRNDVADERLNLYAFTNATIYVTPTEILEGGTLLIRGAFVEAVGKDLKIPTGAIVIDCKGKRIYAGLVDLDSDYGMPEVRRQQGGNFFAGAAQSTKKGAYGWNAAIQPETNAEEVFAINVQKADELRKLGFGAVLAFPHDGIVRGTSALIAPIEDVEQNAVLKGKVSAHYSFNKGSSTQAYPNSMMGSVALLRQTYYDAQWYKRAMNKTEHNISLDHFNHIQSLPQIFETDDRFGVMRADKIGDEFGVQYIIKSGGDDYQRLDEIKATGASLIVPLNFPQAFDVEDPWDAGAVSLAEMKHWEMAPANAGTLTKAGITFALTTAGLRNKADFWANLRKAIEYGLPEAEALKALTTTPATLIKCEEKIGCLKPGCYANLLITSDNLFKADNIIHENWIKGKRHILNDMTLADIRGQYDMKVGDRAMKLNISGKIGTPDYQIVISDSIRVTPKATRYNNLLSMTYSVGRMPGTIRLSGYLDGKDFKGDGEMPNGTPVKWSAVYKEPAKETAARPDTTRPRTPEIGKVLYPFIAFGNEQKPKVETILFKNATVWTNEKDGILQNADVLLENGKISKVGKNLSAPNAKTIDATGKHLTNGIFDEHSHIALFAINEGGQSVTAEVREEDVIDSDAINMYRQLAGGVTSAQLLHGSANCIGGQSALIKFKWGEAPDALKIKGADGFIKFALGENVTRKSQQTGGRFGGANAPRYPISRMGVEQVMMDAFARARDYDKEWKAYEALPAKDKVNAIPPRRDIEMDALAEILNKKRFITCHSYVQSEINMLMKVAESFNFRINTFTHILEGYKVADIMKTHGAGGSSFADWWAYKMEVKDAIPHNPAMLHKAGVVTSINSDDAEMARRLNQEAAKSVQYGGLSEEDAWKMVTLNPAKLLHLDNRMGSIKAGKDADVVLWNTNPLSIYAKPDYTIVDGAIYFDAKQDEQKQKDIDKERARIIQKMIAAKSGGAPTARPQFRRQHIFHCEDEGDLSSLGLHEK
ncbi:MAG: amidohydrolase family protein [Spirosomataceae bacterium]